MTITYEREIKNVYKFIKQQSEKLDKDISQLTLHIYDNELHICDFETEETIDTFKIQTTALSQSDLLLKHFKKHKAITSKIAKDLYDINNLSACVSTLRLRGNEIEVSKSKHGYSIYELL